MKRSPQDDFVLLLVMLLWGFNYVAIKLALREIDALAFLTLRNAIALLVLLAVFFATERDWVVRRGDLARLFLIGLAGVTINQLTFNVGVKYTTASNASLLMTTSPVFGLLYGIVMEGERVGVRRWLGMAAAMVGVSMVIAGGQGRLHFGWESIVGDLLILAGAASWAFYSVLGRPILKRYSPLKLTLYAAMVGLPLMLPVTAGAVLAQPWGAVSAMAWAMSLYPGVLVSMAGVLWYRSIGRVGASRAMVFMYLVPVFAVAAAVIVLQETLGVVQVAGAVVALVGVSVAREG